jgi:hypothetical protein
VELVVEDLDKDGHNLEEQVQLILEVVVVELVLQLVGLKEVVEQVVLVL